MAAKRKTWTDGQVRSFKNRMGWSIHDLAAELGVSKRTIINWLRDGASTLGSLALMYLESEYDQ